MSLQVRRSPATAGLARLANAVTDVRARSDPRRWPVWVYGILAVAVPSHLLAIWRVLGGLSPTVHPPMRDSLIFEYIGWYLTEGGRLYVDIFELKPPLSFEIAAAITLLAGGDPAIAHGLHIALTTVASVGTALVAGALVADITGDDIAAFAAGVSLYVLPAYHWRAAFGFKAKYFVALFALLAILLARRNRPGSAGLAAGATVGFWQLAVVVPALAVGIAVDRGGRAAGRNVVAGTIGVLAVMLLPVVIWGAMEAMVTQTVLVPLLVGNELPIEDQIRRAGHVFGGSLPVVLLGAVGIATGFRRQPRATWWLAAATVWFAIQALVLDLDGAPDVFPLMAFLAVGVGVLVGTEPGHQRPAAILIAILAVLSVVTMGGFGYAGTTLHEPDTLVQDHDHELVAPYENDERAYLYWNQVEPDTCRAFSGRTQHRLVSQTGQSVVQERCGDVEPVLDALRGRSTGG